MRIYIAYSDGRYGSNPAGPSPSREGPESAHRGHSTSHFLARVRVIPHPSPSCESGAEPRHQQRVDLDRLGAYSCFGRIRLPSLMSSSLERLHQGSTTSLARAPTGVNLTESLRVVCRFSCIGLCFQQHDLMGFSSHMAEWMPVFLIRHQALASSKIATWRGLSPASSPHHRQVLLSRFDHRLIAQAIGTQGFREGQFAPLRSYWPSPASSKRQPLNRLLTMMVIPCTAGDRQVLSR
jgi:hypothetical protein